MISIEANGIDEIVADFTDYPGRAGKALVRALNRSMSSGQTVMVRSIAADTGLKQKDVRDRLKLTTAGGTHFEASLAASLKRVPLYDFGAKGTYPSRGKGRGVTAKLSSGAGRYPQAFIAVMASGHRGVFERIPGKYMRFQKPTWKKKRQAIAERFGPSIGHVFLKYRAQTITRVLEVFQANFDHEMAFAKTQAGSDASAE